MKSQYSKRLWIGIAKARRQQRESLGISQSLLAERVGVRGATISRWESGVIKPSIPMMKAWDAALFKEAK